MHIINAFVAAAILNGMAEAAPYLSARTTPAPPGPAKRGDYTLDFDWRQAAREALPAPANDPSQAYQKWANLVREAAPTKRAAATIKRDAAPSKREAEAAPTKRAATSSKAKREAVAASDDRDHKGRRDAAPSKREAEAAPTKRAAMSMRVRDPEAAPSKRAAAPSKREADAAPTKRAAMPSKREANPAPSKREADPTPTKRAALPLEPLASFDYWPMLKEREASDKAESSMPDYGDEITGEPFTPASKRDPEAEAVPTKRGTRTEQWSLGLLPGLSNRDINPPIKRGRSGYNRVAEDTDDNSGLEKRTLPTWDKFSNGDFFLQERSLPPIKRGRSGYNRVAEDSDDDGVGNDKRTLPIWEKFEDYDYADYVKRALGHSRIDTVEDTEDVAIGLKERAVPPRRSIRFEKRSLSPLNDGRSGYADDGADLEKRTHQADYVRNDKTVDDEVDLEERAVPGIKRPWS